MFKTYDVFESVWGMNPFVTLEASRDWSDLGDLASELSAGAESEDAAEIAEAPAQASARRKHAA